MIYIYIYILILSICMLGRLQWQFEATPKAAMWSETPFVSEHPGHGHHIPTPTRHTAGTYSSSLGVPVPCSGIRIRRSCLALDPPMGIDIGGCSALDTYTPWSELYTPKSTDGLYNTVQVYISRFSTRARLVSQVNTWILSMRGTPPRQAFDSQGPSRRASDMWVTHYLDTSWTTWGFLKTRARDE